MKGNLSNQRCYASLWLENVVENADRKSDHVLCNWETFQRRSTAREEGKEENAHHTFTFLDSYSTSSIVHYHPLTKRTWPTTGPVTQRSAHQLQLLTNNQ